MLLAFNILLLRYFILPNIAQFQPEITARIQRSLGVEVKLSQIEADWRGLNPRLHLRDVQLLDNQHHPALILPEVNIRISWRSLSSLQLRFDLLEIKDAELRIQRDRQGNIRIGGIPLSAQGGNNDMSDWLLRQSDVIIHDGKLVWQDALRAAPDLVLRAVNLRFHNELNRHRFALQAMPDARLSTPLDVRGDFNGHSFDHWPEWSGQLYARLAHTDITAWRPWVNLPPEFSQGRGGLQAWMHLHHGKISHLTGDLILQDAVTRLSPEVPAMVLHQLSGRANWQSLPGGFLLQTEKLVVQLHNGLILPSTEVYIRIQDAQGRTPASGEMRANAVQLESLVTLANFVPLPRAWRAQLDGLAPHGKLSGLDVNWEGTLPLPQHFKVKGHFENFGLARHGNLPGFSNLTADIDGNDLSGSLRIQSQQLSADVPGILREPVHADQLSMQLNWQHDGDTWGIDVPYIQAENSDLAGNANLHYRTVHNSPGFLDLNIHLKRADGSKTARYTPLFALSRPVNDWLHNAILAGHSEDFYLRIKGDLKNFPFENNGIFELGATVQGGKLRFSNDWPSVDDISGSLLFRGKQMVFNSSGANMLGVPAQSIGVQIPDLMSAKTVLHVMVDASAESPDFLRLVQGSPIRNYAQGFTDRLQASGKGHLDLKVRLPEVGVPHAEVTGSYFLLDNTLNLGSGIPLLQQLNGELKFSEADFHTQNVHANVLGGPCDIEVQARGGVVQAKANGTVNSTALAAQYPHPWWQAVHGSSHWQADISVRNRQPHVVIRSDLQGLQSDLPAPLHKMAETIWPLQVESQGQGDGSDDMQVQLGALLSGRVRRSADGRLQRGTLNLGGRGNWIDEDGLWITGEIAECALHGWPTQPNQAATPLPIAIRGLHIARVNAHRQYITDLTLNGQPTAAGYALNLVSPVINGDLLWQPQQSGRLQARLRYLNWQVSNREEAANNTPSDNEPQTAPLNPANLPALEIDIEQLQIRNKQIGKVHLSGQPLAHGWQLQQVDVLNPDGTLHGSGVWHGGKQPRTELSASLHISDAGKVLARSGFPNTVENGSGTLSAQLAWNNTPMAFDYATLDGNLKLDTGKGRFLKIEPGIAKLLGILSLQALPRHITLDFTDVFSQGFQFDNINGNATLKKGVLSTQDLHIDGSAAKVTMRGWVNLTQETQNLRVEILPTVSESLSLLSGFAGGPLVGVGTLVLSKVMGNPFDKLVSFQYNITGSLSDPVVVKAGATTVPAPVTKPEK